MATPFVRGHALKRRFETLLLARAKEEIGRADIEIQYRFLVLNYTFHLSGLSELGEVPGYAKDGSKDVKGANDKATNVIPVSTAEYDPCGWRAWLNNTTITLGVNNVMDLQPPFVAGSSENGYDEATANIRGRTWYVALKKRF